MKKLLSVLLTASLLLTTAAPVFGADGDSKGLEQAIAAAKKVFTVPADYKEFSYENYVRDVDGADATTWNLSWNKEDGSWSIHAAVDTEGNLLSYNRYDDSKEPQGLSPLTKTEGKGIADAFLEKAMPSMVKDMKEGDVGTDRLSSYSYNYEYIYQVNDVPVGFINSTITVNKNTKQVTHFERSQLSGTIDEYPKADVVISSDAAKKAYLEKIGMPLKYYSFYDYSKKTLKVFSAYDGYTELDRVIDAKTGEVISLYSENGDRDAGGTGMAQAKAEDAAVSNRSAGALTKEEQNAVTKAAGLMSKEQAEAKLKAAVKVPTDSKLANASLNKDRIDKDKYEWSLSYDRCYGTVNAKTGEVVSFNLYNDGDQSKQTPKISLSEAKSKAEAFAKSVSPQKFAQSKYSEGEYRAVPVEKDSVNRENYGIYFGRQVNGIEFADNGIRVNVDGVTGEITSYSCTWYDTAVFPSTEKTVTAETAFDKISESKAYRMFYERSEKDKVVLVFHFENNLDNYMIDGLTGEKIDWKGDPYRNTAIPAYADVKGHWAEKTITMLLQNGYYLGSSDQFLPNQKITQSEFFRYLYASAQSGTTDESLYKMLIADGMITEKEKSPNAALTRQDAAKFAVRYLGQGKSAEHPEIFVNPFKDQIAQEYKGYAAIAKGLGIMNGDVKGSFNGTATMTRAEASVVIYNALQVK